MHRFNLIHGHAVLTGLLILMPLLSACQRRSDGRDSGSLQQVAVQSRPTVAAVRHDSLCGAWRTAPLITPDSIGPIVIGMEPEALRRRCPEARDARADGNGYIIEAFGASISIEFDRDGSMSTVAVRGGDLRTPDGLGPASTIADLGALGRVKEVYLCDDVPATVVYHARPMLAFWFRQCNATRAIEHLELPDTTRVLLVEVWAPGGI